MIESGLQMERDEDGIGNELRFERWHDLVDKYRLRGKDLNVADADPLSSSLINFVDQHLPLCFVFSITQYRRNNAWLKMRRNGTTSLPDTMH